MPSGRNKGRLTAGYLADPDMTDIGKHSFMSRLVDKLFIE